MRISELKDITSNNERKVSILKVKMSNKVRDLKRIIAKKDIVIEILEKSTQEKEHSCDK